MGKISTYSIDTVPTLDDKVIGTDAENSQITKNYRLSDIVGLIPTPTLQSVLDNGNTATSTLVLNGTLITSGFIANASSVFMSGAEFRSDVRFHTGVVKLEGGVKDDQDALGTAGQFLSTTGTSVRWATPPSLPSSLQQVLDIGNTATQDINLAGSIQVTGQIVTTDQLDADSLAIQTTSEFLGEATFRDNIRVDAGVFDSGGSTGTAGQILSSTGTATEWVDNIQIVQPNLNVVLEASSFDTQEPTGTNTALKVNFGPAQQPNQFIDLSAAGDIIFLEEGTYFVKGFGSVSREGASGGVANLLYRALINGIQVGNTYVIDLDSVGNTMPLTISQPIKVSENDVLSFEIMRDASGVNQGGLYKHVASGGIWTTVPSASITVWKLN